jgi:hypothetical protein
MHDKEGIGMRAKASIKPAFADKGQIKRIHVLASKLELPDSVYRKWLGERYNVTSSKQLTVDQAKDFIRGLEYFAVQCGYWERDPNKAKYNELAGRQGMASPAQLRMVESIWVELTKPATDAERDSTLRAFLFKRFKTSHLKFLDLSTVDKVICALKTMKERGWKGSATTPQEAA